MCWLATGCPLNTNLDRAVAEGFDVTTGGTPGLSVQPDLTLTLALPEKRDWPDAPSGSFSPT